MKKTNLIAILSTLLLSANVYADWPTAFSLCNHSHGAYKVNLSNFNNIAWRINTDSDWMQTREFDIPEHECKEIFVKPNEYGYSKYSSLKIDYSGVGGHASFFLKTDPNDIKHLETNVAHWTMIYWWANSDNMKIEARVSKVARCQNGSCQNISTNKLDTWVVTKNNDNKYSDGTYKFYPPKNEDIQTINLLQTSTNPENYTAEEKFLLAEVYKNLRTLIPVWNKTQKAGLLDLVIRRNDGKQIDLWNAGAICKLYDPYVNVDYDSVSLEQAAIQSFKLSTLTPLVVTREDYDNNAESASNFRSTEVSRTITNGFSEQTKRTTSFKTNLTLGTMVKVPAVSETSKSVSFELEISKSKLKLTDRQTSEMISVPAGMILIPAKSKATGITSLSRQKVSGKVYVNYPLKDYNISGDYALDGDCRNKSANNIVSVKIDPYFLAKYSIDPDKFALNSSGKISLRDEYEFTTEVGYHYSRTLKITPKLSTMKPYEITESLPYVISDKISAQTAKDYVKPLQ